MQALQSLGLQVPPPPTGAGNPPPSSEDTPPSGAATPAGATAPATPAAPATPPASGKRAEKEDDNDDDDQRPAASGIQSDIRQFMHALFQAVRGQGTDAGASTDANANSNASSTEHSRGHKGHFGAGLASLISQVSNGSAPAALQSAFDKLVTDIQAAGASAPAAGGSVAGTPLRHPPQRTLHQLRRARGLPAGPPARKSPCRHCSVNCSRTWATGHWAAGERWAIS